MPVNGKPRDEGAVAVVTGASRGIGAGIARELGARGYRVVVNYRSRVEAAEALVAEIEQAGGTAAAEPGDVCDERQARALIDRTVERFGAVDVLVCNANVGAPRGDIQEIEWDVFSDKLRNELAAAFHPTRAVLPRMAEAGSGRIIYITSGAAQGPANPGMAAHGVAKAALNAYARYVARTAAPLGIGVNVVSPGLVRTEATAELPAELFDSFVARIPKGRAGEPEDIGRVVAFLAGEDSDYLIGSLIPLNGGSDLGR